MRKLMLFGGWPYTFSWLTQFTLRQGLPPVIDMPGSLDLSQLTSPSNPSYPAFAVASPDGKYLLVGGGSASSNSYCLYDTSDFATALKPGASFVSVYSAAISNTHFAVCSNINSHPRVYVFDIATLTLQSTLPELISQVSGLCFSPDGAHLYVIQGATTGSLYKYDTSDWSYITTGTDTGIAPGAGRAKHGICLTGDGQRVVTVGNSGNYLSVYPTDLSSRLRGETNSANFQVAVDGGVMPHPTKGRSVLVWRGNVSSTNSLFEYDVDTGTVTPILTTTSHGRVFSVVYDGREGLLYVTYAADNPIQRTGVVVLNISDYSEAYSTAAMSQAFGMNATVYRYADMCLIDTDVARLSGTVRDINNDPAERVVRAYRRSTGLLVAQTVSDDTTGEYELLLPDDGVVDVQFMADSSESLNDLFFAKAIPEPV